MQGHAGMQEQKPQEVSHGRVPVWPWRGKDGAAAVLQALSMKTMSLF